MTHPRSFPPDIGGFEANDVIPRPAMSAGKLLQDRTDHITQGAELEIIVVKHSTASLSLHKSEGTQPKCLSPILPENFA
jgi:hypothetical protein